MTLKIRLMIIDVNISTIYESLLLNVKKILPTICQNKTNISGGMIKFLV